MGSALKFASLPMRRFLPVAVLVIALGPVMGAQIREGIRLGDTPREQTIAGGQTHTFEINLAARDVLRVKVEQGDINLGVRIRGIDQQELVGANNAGAGDVEFVSAIVPATGLYSIDVIPGANDARQGKYKISILNAGPPSARELALVEGDRLFSAANTKRGAGTAQANRESIDGFAAARDQYIAAGEDWRIAESWNRIGISQLALNQYKDALVSFEASRVVVDRIGDRKWQGVLLNNIGLTHWNLSEVSEALAAHEAALVIRREVGDKTGEASTLFNTALVYTGIGEPDKAVTLHEQTLPLRRLVGDKAGEVRTLSSLANAHRAMGHVQEAFDNLAKALAIVQDQNDKAGEVEVLRSMASSYYLLGDLVQAQQSIDAALNVGMPLGNRRVITLMRGVSADIAAANGDVQGALELFKQVVAEHRALGNRIDELGGLIRVARLQLQLGDIESARAGQVQADALARQVNDAGNLANAYDIAGFIALADKKPDVAAAAFREEMALWARSVDHLGQADAHYGLARALAASGDPAAALKEADESLNEIETIRVSVRNPELRASYRARTQRFFELKVDLLMGQHAADANAGHDIQALVANDTSRARSLLESFGGNVPEIVQDADPALLADRDAKGRRVNELDRRRTLAIDNKSIVAPTVAELATALREYRDAEGKVFASNPRTQALLAPPTITAAALKDAAGTDSVIVEYALGESRSFAWTVTASGITSAVLPARSAIEDAAAKLYRATTVRNTAANDSTVDARRARLANTDRESAAAARALAKIILDPVAPQLGARRVIFVVDGALSTVPFALLPTPVGGRPLADTNAIALLPSVTLVSALRQKREPHSGTVAVFADPVFDSTDPRVGSRQNPTTEANQPLELQAAMHRDGTGKFGRLRFSREEADAITSMVPRNAGYSALDFSANRTAAQSTTVRNARIVHFATHGIVNPTQPELSGLVLSLVESNGRSQDGFLRLHDIYRLHLSADLVVLSACRSAVGKDFKGEGPMALTRGFLVAGAPRVVATLWDVDDRATAELMRLFYTGVLVRHVSPAVALRSAQMELAKNPQWSAPYFWAGFTLTGEWR